MSTETEAPQRLEKRDGTSCDESDAGMIDSIKEGDGASSVTGGQCWSGRTASDGIGGKTEGAGD